MAFMMHNSFLIAAVMAIILHLPRVSTKARWYCFTTELCWMPTKVGRNSRARTWPRPPPVIRFPRNIPLSRLTGATPNQGGNLLSVQDSNSGDSVTSHGRYLANAGNRLEVFSPLFQFRHLLNSPPPKNYYPSCRRKTGFSFNSKSGIQGKTNPICALNFIEKRD